jgi:catalase
MAPRWVAQAIVHLNEVVPEDYVQAKGLWDVLGSQPGQQDISCIISRCI